MHYAVSEAIAMHALAEQLHFVWRQKLVELETAIRSPEESLSQEDRADLIFFLKRTAEVFDDLRKASKRNTEQLENIIGSVFVAQQLMMPASQKSKSVKGYIALATVNVHEQPKLPSPNKEPTKYGVALRAVGVESEETIRRGLLRFHWPSMVEWATELAEQGQSLPEGLSVSDNESSYTTTSRKRADVQLEDVVPEDIKEVASRLRDLLSHEESEEQEQF